jgi:hypothetical protein
MTLIAVDEGAAELFVIVAAITGENGLVDVPSDAVAQTAIAKTDLPATDPQVVGALFQTSGVINISAG